MTIIKQILARMVRRRQPYSLRARRGLSLQQTKFRRAAVFDGRTDGVRIKEWPAKASESDMGIEAMFSLLLRPGNSKQGRPFLPRLQLPRTCFAASKPKALMRSQD